MFLNINHSNKSCSKKIKEISVEFLQKKTSFCWIMVCKFSDQKSVAKNLEHLMKYLTNKMFQQMNWLTKDNI